MEPARKKINHRLFYTVHKTSYDIFLSAGILIACTLIGFVFFLFDLSEANIITIYILGIILISSVTTRRIFGMASSIVGVLLFNCMFADPRFTLLVYDPQYTITIFILLIVSLITGYVTTQLRRQVTREKLEAHRYGILLEMSQHLQRCQNEKEIYQVAICQLNQLYHQPVMILPLCDSDLGQPILSAEAEDLPDIEAEDREFLLNWLVQDASAEQFTVRSVKNQRVFFFKIKSTDLTFAIVGLSVAAGEQFPPYEQHLLLTLLDEVALSIVACRLRESNERVAREAETQRLHTNFLRTISHDLRTPLTSISGNADILLSRGELINEEKRQQLYQDILEVSDWLTAMVENILFITRIENGKQALILEAELLQDIIPEAIDLVSKHGKRHHIEMQLPDELLFVRVDARMIMQVLINIIDNAIKYTPQDSLITVRAWRDGTTVVIEIADNGQGIAADKKERIFDTLYTSSNGFEGKHQGMGLGLSLCRTIMLAHGGNISLADNLPHGTVVQLMLNLEESTADEDTGY